MDDLVDIITLENLEQKLPQWNPSSPSHFHALVDMGSNGIRFSILDLSPPQTRLLRCVYRERAAISLFDALSGPSLLFPDETIHLVSKTLARFRSIAIDDYGVPPNQLRVFATEAMRRAQNAKAMLEAIGAASPGLSVSILAPPVETLFGSVGACSGFVDVKGLFLDLGGGSVQMTYLDSGTAKSQAQDGAVGPEVAAALAGQSLPFGAARLIKILNSSDAEVKTSELSLLHNGMSEAFKTLCARFPTLAAAAEAQQSRAGTGGNTPPGIDVYLCGGGFRGYGSMLMRRHPIQPYPIPSIGAFKVSGELFGGTKELLKFNESHEGKVFGMSKRRRLQFPAIVAVVDALIAAVPPIRSVTFCAGGNREGVLMMSLPPDIRYSNPLDCPLDTTQGSLALPPKPVSASVQDVLDALQSAFPESVDLATTTTVFGLQLGTLYAQEIWNGLGSDAEKNASAALHHAASSPEQPGLTHLARAVLGVTTRARWGAGLAPVDEQLENSLRALIESADPAANFWADYTGAVTAAVVALVKRWPSSKQAIQDKIRFRSTVEDGNPFHIKLQIFVNETATAGLDFDEIVDLFKSLKKYKHSGKQVLVNVATFP
ncbi:Ppx/GppA phosphatase family-domain-containing protein [Chaetomium sp. MPI-SDFR-AT-0129]|nr:Ppx/GppA phosphatase family-domain-containing protein [Chaetomium sp. MPI-SDFR-AT-0129]